MEVDAHIGQVVRRVLNASTSGIPRRRMAGKAPISRHTARIPWVAILSIRGSRPELKLWRNTSASSEGIH
jgi:hypothetical protein